MRMWGMVTKIKVLVILHPVAKIKGKASVILAEKNVK
jgi:hypothetical protein